jgi:hypothetical protein
LQHGSGEWEQCSRCARHGLHAFCSGGRRQHAGSHRIDAVRRCFGGVRIAAPPPSTVAQRLSGGGREE